MTILLGTDALGTDGDDFEQVGRMIGSIYVALATDIIDTITLRTGASNTYAGVILLAVLADVAGTPGAKIGNQAYVKVASGKSTRTSSPGINAKVTAGVSYWIMGLSPVLGGNTWHFALRDSTTVGGTKDENAVNLNATTSWGSTSGTFNEIMAAYAESAPAPQQRRMPLGV